MAEKNQHNSAHGGVTIERTHVKDGVNIRVGRTDSGDQVTYFRRESGKQTSKDGTGDTDKLSG